MATFTIHKTIRMPLHFKKFIVTNTTVPSTIEYAESRPVWLMLTRGQQQSITAAFSGPRPKLWFVFVDFTQPSRGQGPRGRTAVCGSAGRLSATRCHHRLTKKTKKKTNHTSVQPRKIKTDCFENACDLLTCLHQLQPSKPCTYF